MSQSPHEHLSGRAFKLTIKASKDCWSFYIGPHQNSAIAQCSCDISYFKHQEKTRLQLLIDWDITGNSPYRMLEGILCAHYLPQQTFCTQGMNGVLQHNICGQHLRLDNAMPRKHPVFLLTLASTASFLAASKGRYLHSPVYSDFASMTQWLYEPVRPVSSGRRHRFIAQQWQPQTKALKTRHKGKKKKYSKEGVRTILHFCEILINFISR